MSTPDYTVAANLTRVALNLRSANDALGDEVARVAADAGLCATRYSRHYGKSFDGWILYAAYAPGLRPQNLRSRRIRAHTQARFSKYGWPSIIGEKRALTELLSKLQEV